MPGLLIDSILSSTADSKHKLPLTQKSDTGDYKMSWADEVNDAMAQSDTEMQRSTDELMEIDGVPAHFSQPPSPEELRPPTPRLTLDPCPARLLPLYPASNYGAVVRNQIFRSAFPQAHNMEFMAELGIRSILTLVVKTESCEAYNHFVSSCTVNRKILNIEPNKEGKVRSNFDTLCEAILFAINPANHPVWIHCNQGRHRTGCVVACIRKIQQWPMDEILEEYNTYAHPKPRDGDIQLIKDFEPEYVHEYGRREHMLEDFASLLKNFGRSRTDSFYSVYELGSSIPSHNTSSIYSSSNSSVSDDGPMIMADKNLKAQADAEMNIDPMLRSTTPDVTVEEVDEEDDLDSSMETHDGDGDNEGVPELVAGTSPPRTPPPLPPKVTERDVAAEKTLIERVTAYRRQLWSATPAGAFFLRSNRSF